MDLSDHKYNESFTQIKLNVGTLTNILYNYEFFKRISRFLSLKDVLNIGQTCSILNEVVEKHQEFFGEIYYKLFLNEQLEMTLELNYPDILRRQYIRQSNFDNSLINWKNQLIKMIQTKQTFKFPFILCDVVFPKPILTRETIGIYCESNYQIMLAQRLELEQKGFNKLFDYQFIQNELMNELIQNKQQILVEMQDKLQKNEKLKRQFLQYRWSLQNESFEFQQFNLQNIDKVEQDSENKMESISDEQISIFNLMEEFYTSLKCYLKGLQKYFSVFINVNTINSIDLLCEYVMYWQAYSNAIMDLSTFIYPFENIINELHSNLFPNYPQYPKFSVWRVMTKMWIKYIIRYQQLSVILLQCFIRLLSAQRQQMFKQEFDQGVNDDFENTQSFLITYEIYDNFLLKQRNSCKDQFQIDTTHLFYTEIVDLLRSFCRCIQDISISEVSVHWVGHKDCCYEEFYEQLSEKIQYETSLYYDESRQIFGSNIISFIEFIKFDKEFLQQIIPEPLLFKIENLQREHIYTSLYYFLEVSYLQKFVQTNKDQIILVYKNSKPKSPKQERISITSSLNNEHLETQGDSNLNDAQKFFNLCLENSNLDLEELLIKEKNKNQSDLLLEIIKVALSQMNLDQLSNFDNIDQYGSQKDLFDFNKTPKIHRAFSNTKLNAEQTEVPEEITKAAKQYLLADTQFYKLYQVFIEYSKNYDKILIQVINKDRDVELINDDREVPRILPEYLQNFYYVSNNLTYSVLEENIIEDQEDEFEDLDLPLNLQKNQCKLKCIYIIKQKIQFKLNTITQKKKILIVIGMQLD
ncbi:unnamed protein product [Paramecium pentaurelia]|uniref:F-box domain-containing protein n=1 Tax=Paramecium pentaurelia TaxID=43138 RepID=A0A8S1UBY4_9CILI|nr:unnamed protein product [Paramecium pentaurelia]